MRVAIHPQRIGGGRTGGGDAAARRGVSGGALISRAPPRLWGSRELSLRAPQVT